MSDVEIRETKLGKGVFAAKDFYPDEWIMDFKGERMSDRKVPDNYLEVEDYYTQIGPHEYLGPSGEADDFVNHSCNPNGALIITPEKIFLKCIQPIKSGQEITWDYSTTMNEDGIIIFGGWELDCQCGEGNCRKKIRDFKYLPTEIQQKYIGLDIVPEYIIKK